MRLFKKSIDLVLLKLLCFIKIKRNKNKKEIIIKFCLNLQKLVLVIKIIKNFYVFYIKNNLEYRKLSQS